MKIFDKCIVKNFLMPFLYCLIVFYILFIVADILGHLDEILKNKVPLNLLGKYYLFFIPIIFVQTVPIAALLATIYLLSTMNKNNELTAMKASGINITAAMIPVFVIGAIISLSIFYINETIAPKASLITNNIKNEHIETDKKNTEQKVIKNLTIYGKASQMIYAKKFDSIANKLYDIILLEHGQNQALKRKILAKEALWLNDKWKFFDVIIYRFDELAQPMGKVLTFDEKIIRLPETPRDLLKGEFTSSFMNYMQLKTYIKRLKGGDKNTINRLKTDLYFKLSLPFITLIIMLLGMPFALTTKRGGVATSMGIGILVGLIYYASIGVSLAFGKGNFLPPVIAAHFSNVLFFIIAIILIRKAPA